MLALKEKELKQGPQTKSSRAETTTDEDGKDQGFQKNQGKGLLER